MEIITPTGTVSVWTPHTYTGVFEDVSLLQNTAHILSSPWLQHDINTRSTNSNLGLRVSLDDLNIIIQKFLWWILDLWVLKGLPCLGHQLIKL